ncbi:MAG: hypothetical protein RMK99_05760 [Anaerolineales bacterium]|nr:hypothetical protein [Anaerolineales bacterium]
MITTINWLTRLVVLVPGLYGLYTIGIGIQELLAERIGGQSAVVQGILLVALSALLMAGLFRTWLWLAWLGWLLLALAALVFLFGVGPPMLPVVILLFILLSLLTWLAWKRRAARPGS